MRLSWAATLATLLGLALALCSCGEDGTGAAQRSRPSAATPGGRAADPCRTQLGGFIGSMARLRDELARGLDYDRYLGAVRGTRVLYAAIRADRIPAGCLLASGGPAERAFNLYIDAANAWGDCLATVACDTREVEPELQRRWAIASDRLSAAQRGMREAPR